MIRSLAAALTLAAGAAYAEPVEVAATGSVAEVTDRLEAAVTGAGATVFARVDHGAGAASVEMELADAQLLIFGNPMLGTPAMQADIRAGMVLPLRVLVYTDAEGGTWLSYEPVEDLFEGLDIPAEAEVRGRIAGALERLTTAAASP